MINKLGDWANNIDKKIDKTFNYGNYPGSAQLKPKCK